MKIKTLVYLDLLYFSYIFFIAYLFRICSGFDRSMDRLLHVITAVIVYCYFRLWAQIHLTFNSNNNKKSASFVIFLVAHENATGFSSIECAIWQNGSGQRNNTKKIVQGCIRSTRPASMQNAQMQWRLRQNQKIPSKLTLILDSASTLSCKFFSTIKQMHRKI